MGTLTWLILCIICIALGGGASFFLCSKKSEQYKKENYDLNAQVKSLTTTNEQIKSEKEELSTKYESLNTSFRDTTANLYAESQNVQNLKKQYEELKNDFIKVTEQNSILSRNLQDSVAKYSAETEKNKWIESADKTMREAFGAMSKEIIESSNVDFINKANDKLNDFASKLDEKMRSENKTVEGMLTPVSENLTELKKHIGELEKNRLTAYTDLNKVVDVLREQNDKLTNETRNLNSALHNSSVRGKWGEAQLRRVAELSGMTSHIDFEEQKQNDNGKRPDMIVTLSGGRTVPVDSKVPMEDYLKYVECKDEEQRKMYLAGHAKAVKSHVDALAKKTYWKSEDRSIQLVALVIPYESGLSAAFEGDPELFEYAESKNVLLLSPVTFYAFLKSVLVGWTEYNLVQNAQEIAKLSNELIDRFETFVKYFEEIGKGLDKAVGSYNKAINSYNSRLNATFNKLRNLKQLPEHDMIDTVELLPNYTRDSENK